MNVPSTAVRPTLLVVDDTPANLALLAGIFNKAYRVKLATSGMEALKIAERDPPDLILLDIMMPLMDGYETCRRLKLSPRTEDIPVIFVTGMIEPEDEERGFAAGAVDFIHKPISPLIVRKRVQAHLELKLARDQLAYRNAGLEKELFQRLDEVQQLQDTTMFVMVSLAEFRDEETGNHVIRTQEYVRALAEFLSEYPPSDCDGIEKLDSALIDLLAKSAPLHDIGKVAIPDQILLKPGRLNESEMAIMRSHAVRGWEILDRAAKRSPGGMQFLCYAMEIARGHHERWDGTGYPDRLAGSAIPFSARLMAVADVYDALISRRCYKEPYSHEESLARIVAAKGTHFDPRVVEALLGSEERIISIAEAWKD